jgi:hypothetical protein
LILSLSRAIVNLIMAKKRKTRQQKIILQLKRDLAAQAQNQASANLKSKPRQGAKLSRAKKTRSRLIQEKKTDNSILSYNPKLIKKDLAKTAFLALIALSLQFVLYLYLG